MAHTHNFKKNHRTSWIADIGNKVKYAAEVVGAAKGLYDVGRSLYHGMQVIGPAVAGAASVLL